MARPIEFPRSVTSLGASEIASRLGPAEAQYGEQALELGLVGALGELPCGTTIIDGDANDTRPELERIVGVDLAWNDLLGETGYRVQIDRNSGTFVAEDGGGEAGAGVTTAPDSQEFFVWGSATHTYRIFGHVGHAPNHGAAPIPGDVVSNECSVTFIWPEP